jgi:transcriptional regulator with PAS, ATPase and Fis domain
MNSSTHLPQCICVECVRRRERKPQKRTRSFGMPDVKPCAPGDDCTIEDLTRYHIKLVLDKSPTLNAAAATLGIDHATLYRKRRAASQSC